MVMRTDSFSAGGALIGPRNARGTDMAKPKTTAVPKTHSQIMSGAAHAAMQYLGATGNQVAHVDTNAMTTFAELQDEGPTARAPETYKGKGK
jgi:hypothetical protein